MPTYAFAPALADLMVQAFGRCQIRRAVLTAEHLKDAGICANLVQVDFANRGVNLWTVDLVTQALTEADPSYDADISTINILSAYLTVSSRDRIITSISRDDYAAIPNKAQAGTPTVYWFDRQTTPRILLWPTPDDDTVTLKYYRARQIADATITADAAPSIPYRFIEAYTAALAEKLADLYAPEHLPRLEARAARAWREASQADVENAPIMLAPSLSGYLRV